MTPTLATSTKRRSPLERSEPNGCLPVLLPVCFHVPHLSLDPVFYGVGHDGLAQRLRSATAFLVGHGEGLVEGVGLLVQVEGVDGDGVLPQLLVGAGILGENQDTVILVDDDRLLDRKSTRLNS